jgi:hypothetical protein
MIKYPLYRFALCLFCGLLLSACSKPQTPQEVAQTFWQGVISGDARTVVRYSTLTDEQQFDAYQRDWSGMIPSWGKIIIEGNEAHIHTQMSRPDAASGQMLYFITYLVQTGEEWQVDYRATGKAVGASGAVADLVNSISDMGRQLSEKLEQAGEDLNAQMESLAEQFSQMAEVYREQAETWQRQAEDAINEYADILQKQIDQLIEDLERALQEKDQVITVSDRQTIEDTVQRLDHSSRALAQPDIEAIAETGEVVIITRRELGNLDQGVFAAYRQQWAQWLDRLEADLTRLLEEIHTTGAEPSQAAK